MPTSERADSLLAGALAISNIGEPLEEAISLASRLHRRQKDKAERPYILHPLRVMLSFTGGLEDDEARIVAVLHDVVEDCNFSLGALAHHGYSPAVVEAIDAISRREGESYRDYIVRCGANSLAARVKVADLKDNLDPKRPSTLMLPNGTWHKYSAAAAFLRLTRDAPGSAREYLRRQVLPHGDSRSQPAEYLDVIARVEGG